MFYDFVSVESSSSSRLEYDQGVPSSSPLVDTEEIVVIAYFVSAIAREILQIAMGIGREGYRMGAWEYASDPWNLMDMASIILFFAGYGVKNMQSASASSPDDCLIEVGTICLSDIFGFINAPFYWEFQTCEMLYAGSIFFMYIRLLRSFALSERINVIVKIFIKMLNDVIRFLVMYIIFLFAFSVLMVGAGSPRGATDKCNTMGLVFDEGRRRGSGSASPGIDGLNAGEKTEALAGGAASGQQIPADQEDYQYVNCWQSWWFMRTVFQAFGEFYLDEMTNDWSVIFVVLIFFLMNIVLMNLLIAMMAGTYAEVHSKVELERMLELYKVTDEFSRYCAASPAPLNIPVDRHIQMH